MSVNMEDVRLVGAAPLVRAMCEAIGLREIIDRHVDWDSMRCKLSPGQRVTALILNILTSRQPLYRVWESFEDTDCELLLGEGVIYEDLNDDALGRALDKLQEAEARKIFSMVAANALIREAVDTRFLHWDSTSRSLYGEYPEAQSATGAKPARGHSKDHRPDLKQIVLTLLVNREGIPLYGEVRDGNSSDKKANREMVEELCRMFSPEQLRQLVYVADSALVTGSNLQLMREINLRFLSRLPENFSACREAKAAAWAGEWTALGKLSSRRGAAEYFASEQQGIIEDQEYRLVVYRSSHLDRRRAKTLERELIGQRQELERDAAALAKRSFSCADDARAAAEVWKKEHQDGFHPVTVDVAEVAERQKQGHRGRPRKGEEPSWRTAYHLVAQVGNPDEDQVKQELERRSTFVLITPLSSAEFPADRLLREYKDQTYVEKRFQFLKDPVFVDAFFLHRPERIEALGYVLLMACLVFSLLERRVRNSGRPLISPSRGKLDRPTGMEILRHIKSAMVGPVGPGQRMVTVSPSFRESFRAILSMAGFDETVYTRVPVRRSG